MEHLSKPFSAPILELARARRSVRTFDGGALRDEDRQKLTDFIAQIENPYGIATEFRLLDANAHNLSSPVISGTDLYVAVKAKRQPHVEEAVGYSLEQLVLYAQSLGIGTVWIGGTMDRPAFERAMNLAADEIMPCVSPLGYPSSKMSLKELTMRKTIKADSRLPFETLFFAGSFAMPLTEKSAGPLAELLEAVRLAPSAVNKQPWRVVAEQDAVHFYLQHAKGFSSNAAGDMQKIDMGIALCHFALAAEERGLRLRFSLDAPAIAAAPDMEYIASYRLH